MAGIVGQRVVQGIPGYHTLSDVCERLRISRETLYYSGLLRRITRYEVKGAASFYRTEDLLKIEKWLRVREGLIRLGVLGPNSPVGADDRQWEMAMSGYWDAPCPICGEVAVKDETPWGDKFFCEMCGPVLKTIVVVNGERHEEVAAVEDLGDDILAMFMGRERYLPKRRRFAYAKA